MAGRGRTSSSNTIANSRIGKRTTVALFALRMSRRQPKQVSSRLSDAMRAPGRTVCGVALACMVALAPAAPAAAQTAAASEPIRIARAAGPIAVDGVLDDEGWKGAVLVERWYETNPGD